MDEAKLPTNDLIERLVAGLSPEARELHAQMAQTAEAVGTGAITEAEAHSRIDGFLTRVELLSGRDREALVRLQRLNAAADQSAAEEHMEAARQAQAAAAVIERAQELEREAGRARNDGMTLGEALAVLEQAELGEDPARVPRAD